MSVLLAGVPMAGAACSGEDSTSGPSLPPIITTTTTTVLITTTTEYVPITYEIQPGDKLGNIATQFGVNRKELMELNNITNPNHIEVGEVLLIPPPTIVATTTTTPTTLAPMMPTAPPTSAG
jgi:lipoprotein NlpD